MWPLGFALALSACEDPAVESNEGRIGLRIVAGESAEAVKSAIFIEIESDIANQPLRCSGTIVAPNVVIGARHCFLIPRLPTLPECTADGDPVDPSVLIGKEQRAVLASAVRVGIGARRSTARRVEVKEVFLTNEATTCRRSTSQGGG
jgi:hypothetical protein